MSSDLNVARPRPVLFYHSVLVTLILVILLAFCLDRFDPGAQIADEPSQLLSIRLGIGLGTLPRTAEPWGGIGGLLQPQEHNV